MDRWQFKTTNTQTGDCICTTEMPYLSSVGLDYETLGYRYESCIFFADGDSDVLARYNTLEEANADHIRLVAERWGHQNMITDEGVVL